MDTHVMDRHDNLLLGLMILYQLQSSFTNFNYRSLAPNMLCMLLVIIVIVSLFRFSLALLKRIGRPFHSCTTLRTRWTVWTWWTSLGWTTETRASLDWLIYSSLWHRSSYLWWTTGNNIELNLRFSSLISRSKLCLYKAV